MQKIFFLFAAFLFAQSNIMAQWDQSNLPNITSPVGSKVGIGFPTGAGLLAKFHLQNNGFGKGWDASSNSNGLVLENSTETSASTTETQSSPPIVLIGHGLKPAVGATPATDKLMDYKIDVSNTSTPFGGGQVLWGPDYSAFRIQRRFATTDIYSDFFSISAKIDAAADLTLRLGQTKFLSNSSGVNILYGHSSSGGTIGFYNHPGSIMYGRFLTEGTNAGNLTIGGNPPAANSSALLQLESTTRGFLMPRMTSTERNAIASPAEGLMVYDKNADAKSPYYYDGTKWNKMGGGSGNPNVMYVSPLQFGANFDDTQPDDDALEATYAYCNSLPYDKLVVIQLPPGICRITRPWVIGAYYMDETKCFRNLDAGYGYPAAVPISAALAQQNAHAKSVSIEGSGATAIYLDFDAATYKAGIYYTAAGNNSTSLELYNYHISGIGVYGQGYFEVDPGNANHYIPKYPRKANHTLVTNNLIGLLCMNNNLTIENCTFRDLREGVVINHCGATVFRKSNVYSCGRAYYAWQAHGSIIENATAFYCGTGFEIRSGQMTVSNIYIQGCPTSLWIGNTASNTFNGCYIECGNAVSGKGVLVIGDNPGDPVYGYFPRRNSAHYADGIQFSSLTVTSSNAIGGTGISLEMRESARKLAIRGGSLESSNKKLTEYRKILNANEEGNGGEVWTDNQLVLQGVIGTFVDYYTPTYPTGNENMTGKVSIEDINGTFRTMKLTNTAMGSTANGDGTRHLCLDDKGNIVLCPTTP